MIEVCFVNLMSGSYSVRSRTFADEGAMAQWLDSVRGLVELVSVSRVAAT